MTSLTGLLRPTASTPLVESLAQHYADAVLASLAEQATSGVLINTAAGCWHDLHDLADTAELAQNAGAPWGADVATDADPAGTRWIAAVEYLVDRALHTAAETAPCGTMDSAAPTGADWTRNSDGYDTAPCAFNGQPGEDAYWQVRRSGDGWLLEVIFDGPDGATANLTGQFVSALAAKTTAEVVEFHLPTSSPLL
jgi:hypothetical protein